MYIYIKNISYILIILAFLAMFFYFSFKAGYEEGRQSQNTFSRLMLNTTVLTNILEFNEKNEDQKIKDYARYFLIDNLFETINSYNWQYLPIDEYQERKMQKNFTQVLKLMKEYNFDLFEKIKQSPDIPTSSDFYINRVKENLEKLAQIQG